MKTKIETTATAKAARTQLKAKNYTTGLFYNKELGGFHSFVRSATLLNREQLAVVRATFENVVEEKQFTATPQPDKATARPFGHVDSPDGLAQFVAYSHCHIGKSRAEKIKAEHAALVAVAEAAEMMPSLVAHLLKNMSQYERDTVRGNSGDIFPLEKALAALSAIRGN